jgi:hypothetical protein
MALDPSFSVSQPLDDPNILIIEDTSTGVDGGVTTRRVYLQKADGTYLVPDGTETDYIEWDYSEGSIEIDVLDKDYALSVRVDWLTGDTVTYTETELAVFTLHSNLFYYGLTQDQTGNPQIISDTFYYDNKMKLRCSIDEAENATQYGVDIYSAQAALSRAKYMMDNQDKYF